MFRTKINIKTFIEQKLSHEFESLEVTSKDN